MDVVAAARVVVVHVASRVEGAAAPGAHICLNCAYVFTILTGSVVVSVVVVFMVLAYVSV